METGKGGSKIEWRVPIGREEIVARVRRIRRSAASIFVIGILTDVAFVWWFGPVLRVFIIEQGVLMRLIVGLTAFPVLLPLGMLLYAWKMSPKTSAWGATVRIVDRGLYVNSKSFRRWKEFKAWRPVSEESASAAMLVTSAGLEQRFGIPAERSSEVFAALADKLPIYDMALHGPTHRYVDIPSRMLTSLLIGVAIAVALGYLSRESYYLWLARQPRAWLLVIAVGMPHAFTQFVTCVWYWSVRPRLNPTQRSMGVFAAIIVAFVGAMLLSLVQLVELNRAQIAVLERVPAAECARVLESVSNWKPCHDERR